MTGSTVLSSHCQCVLGADGKRLVIDLWPVYEFYPKAHILLYTYTMPSYCNRDSSNSTPAPQTLLQDPTNQVLYTYTHVQLWTLTTQG